MLRLNPDARPKPKKNSNPKKAYALAGVDVDLGNQVKRQIGKLVQKTRRPEVLGQIGGFGGLFRARFPGYKDPVLVSSVDGVGSKLKIAAMTGRHNTVGRDLVNHCVNDIAALGADPLFFLDYLGLAKLNPQVFEQILSGLSAACAECGCALIGGETAQMPDVYHGEDYDLVGTIIGVVERRNILDGSDIRAGDIVIGLPSNGLHTNGYTLARKLLFEEHEFALHQKPPGFNESLSQALMAVHTNYLPILQQLRKKVSLKGIAHITGGGLIDNLPRILPKGTAVTLEIDAWPRPPLFQLLASLSQLSDTELYQTFNMGIGMAVVVRPQDAKEVLARTPSWQIGKIVKGNGRVHFVRQSKPSVKKSKKAAKSIRVILSANKRVKAKSKLKRRSS